MRTGTVVACHYDYVLDAMAQRLRSTVLPIICRLGFLT